jgi:Mycothiol maleylpyruvate isomerase N-terminal domain
MTSETITKLIGYFESNRERFIEFCRSLSDEQLQRPVPNSTYTVKDFVSHLGTLDPLLAEQFDALASGNNEPLGRRVGADGQPFDIDKYNDAVVAERHDWSLDAILDEAAKNREVFLASLAKLEDAQIEQTMRFTGDNKRPAADIPYKLFLSGLTRHDPIHVADMVKALPERGEDSAIKEWINDTVVQWYQTTMSGPPKR